MTSDFIKKIIGDENHEKYMFHDRTKMNSIHAVFEKLKDDENGFIYILVYDICNDNPLTKISFRFVT